jgi:xylan 1,4-beta-xylosidase
MNRNEDIMTNLEQAIAKNDLALVEQILIETPSCIDDMTTLQIPMSCYAASLGFEEIFRYIVEYSRASFNEADKYHRTVLHYATESGNLSLVRYIVEKVGISPVYGDTNLVTPLDLAITHKFQPIIDYYENYLGCRFDQMYRNPILTGMHPDPSIVRVGEDYYMVNSSFIYFPCIPISHSKDLIHWEVIGHAITNPEWAYLDELEGGRGYWAPDISYHKGRFYISATYRLNDTGTIYRRQMVVSSDHPEGPYCEPSFIEEDGIDPSIFTDEDGKRYMLLNRGARIFEISEDGTKQLSKAELLYYGDNKRAPEGPHLLRKDGYYYLFLAEGGTGPGHRITVSRSRELFGNYEPCPYNPIMTQVDMTAPIMRCGHGKPVQTQNGEWFMVYLCARMIDGKYSVLGRETALDPITWTMDGWPIVNSLRGPSTLQKKPNLPAHPFKVSDDDWKTSKEWVCPRPPVAGGIYITSEGINLTGSQASLSTMYARNLYLRRQTHFDFEFSATMKLPELKLNQHAGVTCYYDENTYLVFSIVFLENQYVIQVVEHIDEDDKISFQTPLSIETSSQITFKVITKGLKRSFSYRINDGEDLELGVLDNVNYLCDEGLQKGKRFTGAMFGIYAYAGENQSLIATFTDFYVRNCN